MPEMEIVMETGGFHSFGYICPCLEIRNCCLETDGFQFPYLDIYALVWMYTSIFGS